METVKEQYSTLGDVLAAAYDHASVGKGNKRHATGQRFEDQPMQLISDLVGSNHGAIFQAVKKAQESTRMDKDAAVAELLGAINYLAGAIIFLNRQEKRDV